jgi:hypothetical protein
MRLWTLHPRDLDAKGLVALWREGLLAMAVLDGRTRGYRNHPQLVRFRAHPEPTAAIAFYLHGVLAESRARHYHFDAAKLSATVPVIARVEESRGQVDYEWQHLLRKLQVRDPDRFRELRDVGEPAPHPLFTIVPGDIREWEKRPEEPGSKPKPR